MAHDDILLEFDATTSPTRRWAHSNSVDEPLGFEGYNASGGAGTGTERAMFADRQGSVIWVTEPASGTVVAAYEYDGFGQITQTQGVLAQPYGYTGREYDAESGLYYYRARSYDPSNGVFLQSDPIGFDSGQFGLYKYVNNNPIMKNDASGLFGAYAMASRTAVSAPTTAGFVNVIGSGAMNLAALISRVLRAVTIVDGMSVGIVSSTLPSGPPGDCNEDQHRRLQERVDRAKDNIRGKCGSDMHIFERAARYYAWTELGRARTALNTICYQGGDPTHRHQALIAFKKASECF